MNLSRELCTELRDKYGEAFYLLDSLQFEKNFIELKQSFTDIYHNFNIAYSYKTNYTPRLCQIVNALGGYAEVVSEMELELALRIGVSPEKIIWNGPIKEYNALKKYISMGVTVNIDSIDEMIEIEKLANNYKGKIFNIGIRCNYDVGDGVVSRFGFDVNGKDFHRAICIVDKIHNIHLINLHCHFAKRNIEFWSNRVKGMIELIDRMKIVPERIDIGGGLFGKMASSLMAQFDFEIPNYKNYAQVIATAFADYYKNKQIKPELVIEPGSALVGDCMKFVGTVKTIKNIRGKNIATILGSQKNISMTGVKPPIEVIHMGNKETYFENIDIVGFTCIEGDVLYKDYVGTLAENDAIIISNCGSYSLVMKPPFILPNFPVLDISGENVEVVKNKENFDDIFHTFVF